MKQSDTKIRTFEDIVLEHSVRYPELCARDLFKLLYQYAFGCEHMVSDERTVCDRIEAEREAITDGTPSEVEELGDYCRVGLSYLDYGLSAQTLGRLFYLSAARDECGEAKLAKGVEIISELVSDGRLPVSQDEFSAALYEWENAKFPPVRHSEKYREIYSPSYRVIAKRYAAILPLLARIDTMLKAGDVRLAIEGGSASGKSTLGKMLAEIYGCTLFHMDDFFLTPSMRTAERLAEAGGNVDRERFLAEVLTPLSRGEEVAYRRYDCSTGEIMPPESTAPTSLTVTEGAYSMHPELADFYNLSVFLEITPELQRARILKRNSPEMAERHFSTWIPMEERYFNAFNIRERCDVTLHAQEI